LSDRPQKRHGRQRRRVRVAGRRSGDRVEECGAVADRPGQRMLDGETLEQVASGRERRTASSAAKLCDKGRYATSRVGAGLSLNTVQLRK